MRLSVGERYARCPYCGGTEFLEAEPSATPPLELACAQCGGFASRKIVLESPGDEATGADIIAEQGMKP